MVTRTQIAEHLEGAFAFGALSRRQILIAADLRGASEEVLRVLGQLPEGTYFHLRELWPRLSGVPRSL